MRRVSQGPCRTRSEARATTASIRATSAPRGARTPSEPCGAFGERDEADLVLNPGRCSWVDPSRRKTARPPCWSTRSGSARSRRTWSGAQLLLAQSISRASSSQCAATRRCTGSTSTDGKFSCGQENGDNDDGCDSLHRSGDVPSDNLDALRAARRTVRARREPAMATSSRSPIRPRAPSRCMTTIGGTMSARS